MITWILMGSLSLNYLYIKRELERKDNKIEDISYAKGFAMGIILGPLTIPISWLIDRGLNK